MKNITTKIEKNILTVTVDLTQENGSSKSGKTTIIASTGGNINLGHDSGAIMGLNIYKARKL